MVDHEISGTPTIIPTMSSGAFEKNTVDNPLPSMPKRTDVIYSFSMNTPIPPPPAESAPPQGVRLLDQVRDRIRYKHYSIRTEHAYVRWIRRFVHFSGGPHPRDLGPADVVRFLTHLAVQAGAAASTQKQAKSAVLFLYREVLDPELSWLDDVEGAKQPQRLPVVLTPDETDALLRQVSGVSGLIVHLLYGTGMRLMESVRMQVEDVDCHRREILVREGKGAKDRITMLPEVLIEPLRAHLGWVRAMHKAELARRHGEVYLPYALARKYPSAPREWVWQYVFLAARPRVCSSPDTWQANSRPVGCPRIEPAQWIVAVPAPLPQPPLNL